MTKRVAVASLLFLAAFGALLWNGRYWSWPARSGARLPGQATHDGPAPPPEPPATSHDAPEPQAEVRTGVGNDAVVPLFGRVIEEGTKAPVPDAVVRAFAYETGRIFRTTSTADGSFDLPEALGAGRVFELVVRHESHATASRRVLGVRIPTGSWRAAPNPWSPVEVELGIGGTLRGRVLREEDGAPVAGCRVSAVALLDHPLWDRHRPLLAEEIAIEATALTATNGVFEIADLRAGGYALMAVAEGFAPCTYRKWRTLIDVVAGAVVEVTLTLAATGPFFIDVIDEETGSPLDDVWFEAGLDVGGWKTYIPLAVVGHGGGAYELRTGCRRQRLEDTKVRVSKAGYAPRCISFSGQHAGWQFRVALGRGGTIEGHVWQSGEPARGAFVLIERMMDQSVISSAVTAADGGFELGRLEADEELSVHVYDRTLEHEIAILPLVLQNGERRTLDIGGRAATSIEGRLSLGSGGPVGGAVVWVESREGERVRGWTNPDGRFRFEGLRPGRYEVLACASFVRLARRVDVAEGQCVRVEMDVGRWISGKVLDAQTREPVTDVPYLDVVARLVDAPSEDVACAEVERDGSFQVHVAETGLYELDCPDSHELYAIERPRVEVVDKTREIMVRVVRDTKDGQVALDVCDAATGEVVADGRCEHHCKWSTSEERFEDGRIEESGLPVGLHEFRVWSDVHAPSIVEITLTPERDTVRQTILLRPSEAVRVVEIERGGPAARAGLRVGDVITSVRSRAELRRALEAVDEAITIGFERAGERKIVTLPVDFGAEVENILLGR